jgi:hypothetical protein
LDILTDNEILDYARNYDEKVYHESSDEEDFNGFEEIENISQEESPDIPVIQDDVEFIVDPVIAVESLMKFIRNNNFSSEEIHNLNVLKEKIYDCVKNNSS